MYSNIGLSFRETVPLSTNKNWRQNYNSSKYKIRDKRYEIRDKRMSVILWRISELAVVSPPFHILSCWFAMSAILRRICDVEVKNNFILYLYIGLANEQDRIWKGGRHEHLIRNNLEMYSILKVTQYMSPVKKTVNVWQNILYSLKISFDWYLFWPLMAPVGKHL